MRLCAPALLGVQAAFATPVIFTPQVGQCDGTFQSGSVTRKPSPQIQVDFQDASGLRVGQQRPSLVGGTRALWTFDDGPASAYTVTDTGCSSAPGAKTRTQTYTYSEPNGSDLLTIGGCVYRDPAICTSTMTLQTTVQAPVPEGTCPANAYLSVGGFTPGAFSRDFTIPTSGQFGKAFAFNGTNHFANAPDLPSGFCDMGTSYTLSAWIQTSASGSNQRILSQQDANNFWGFAVSPSGGLLRFDSRESIAPVNNQSVEKGSGLNNGAFHYVAVTRINGASWRYFIDGALVGTTVAMSTVSFCNSLSNGISSTIEVGRRANSTEFFNGKIDELRIINASVPDEFILLEYNATVHKFSSNTGASFSNIFSPPNPNPYFPSTPANATTARVTYRPQLQADIGPEHQYVFLAQEEDGDSTVATPTYSVTVDKSPPTAPDLMATPTGTRDMLWSWTFPTTICGPPEFTPQYRLFNSSSGALVAVIPNALSFSESFPLEPPNQRHSRVVNVQDLWGTSPLSNSVTGYTLAAVPSNLTGANPSTGSVTLSWSANGNPFYTRYEVTFSPDGFTNSVSTLAALSNDFRDTVLPVGGLSAGTNYSFRVRAHNGRTDDFSGETFTPFATLNFITLPLAPQLSGTALAVDSIRWDWNSVQGAAGYRLRGAGGTPLLVDTPLLTFTSATLSVNAAYGTQITAYNASGEGLTSNQAFAFTRSAAPASAAVTAVSTNAVGFGWDANGNPSYTFYEVNVATDAAFGVVVATRTVAGTALTVSGLFPATTHFARVRSFSGGQFPSAFVLFGSTRTDVDPAIALSTSPPSAYVPPPGTVGLWHFDEGAGTEALDSSGFSNPGTLACLTGGCSSTPTYTTGPPSLGTAVAFGGLANGLVRIPDAAQHDFGGSLTVGAWANPATAAMPNGAAIVAKGTATGEAFSLQVSGGRYQFLVAPGVVVTATSTVSVGRWTHVMGVYDAANLSASLYIDGVLSASMTGIAATRIVNSQPTAVGNRQSGGVASAFDLGFIGAIDDVRLISGALNAAEVLAQYQGSFPAPVALPAPIPGVTLILPPDAFGAPAVIYASADPFAHPIRVSLSALADGLSAMPTGQVLIPGTLIEIVPTVSGLPFTADLGSSATIIFSYADADGDRLLDGTSPPLSAATLRVYTLDTSVIRWVELPTTVDFAARTASALTPHFSVFAMFAVSTIGPSVQEIRVYPVPWKVGSGGRQDAPSLTFDDLPVEGSIRIFTLSGRRVRDLSFTGSDAGRTAWDGRNSAGKPVASGVYFAYVKDAASGATKIIKFAVEK